MSYPFTAARWFSHNAIIEVRALVLHFSEGGGTVSYLTDPRRSDGSSIDVSAHFVLERTGRIVQMVLDEDADHCQHISRGSWSYPGDLSRANGVAVLGSEVMDNADVTRVNRYVHAIEIEGFRETGMNAAQMGSLTTWVAERRAKFPTIRGLLGHGDIQDKACPGKTIPWALLGGHGPTTEEDMQTPITDLTPKLVDTGINSTWFELDGVTHLPGTHDAFDDRYSPYGVGDGKRAIYVTPGGGDRRLVLVKAVASKPVPTVDCSAAVAAEHERTRSQAIAAVEAI